MSIIGTVSTMVVLIPPIDSMLAPRGKIEHRGNSDPGMQEALMISLADRAFHVVQHAVLNLPVVVPSREQAVRMTLHVVPVAFFLSFFLSFRPLGCQSSQRICGFPLL